MDYHQSIAATCEQTVAALFHTLSAHGYRLERSFDLRSARHAAQANHDQYLVLLACEQTTAAPPLVITAHECMGVTTLKVEGYSVPAAFATTLDEMMSNVTHSP
jgi:hypothetical protein